MPYKKIATFLVGASAAWFLFSFVTFLTGWVPYEWLEPCANIVELIVAPAAAVLLFLKYYKSRNILTLGIGSAVLCWTLRELFWFSYVNIMGKALPYPSVGDFGFLGYYFFMAGALTQLQKRNKHPLIILSTILIILVPTFILFNEKCEIGILILNFIFIIFIAFVTFQALSKYSKESRVLFCSILLFSLNDIIFIAEVNIKDYTFYCDMLYPLSLALLTYGVVKEGVKYD